jgi:hypothetical protein
MNNKMKKKLTYYIIGLLSILTTGCTELEDKSYSLIISEDFEPTAEDLSSLVGTAYGSWRECLYSWDNYIRIMELTSDESVIPARPNGWVDGGKYRILHEHKWTEEDAHVDNNWNTFYAGINNCNRVIYQIESGSIPVTEGKESVIAELKLLRASYYYMLCDFYGNIPIITQYDVPEGFLPEQSTRKEVFDFIIKEIKDNMPLLSDQNGGIMYGRFNKWGAWALLAKMYINAGVYTGTSMWSECINACDELIGSNLFDLDASQKDVFAVQNDNAKEMIFAIPFDNKYINDYNITSIFIQSLQPANQATFNLNEAPYGGICATPQFINTFDTDDARYQDNWFKGDQFSASGELLLCTMGSYSGKPLSYINEVPSIAESEEVHGFRLGKFEIEIGSRKQQSNDWPLFRYADVLMMKAECLLRLGQADEAAKLVTQVRARNFKGDYAAGGTKDKATVTGADLQRGSCYDYGRRDNRVAHTFEGGDDIQYGRMLDELGWEFHQESRRRQDMIRFGAYTTKSWFSHDASKEDFRTLLPVPRNQLEKNSNLTQNPGY